MTLQEFLTRYRFDRTTDRLGAGSFGTVYRAYDTVLDGWVALKISPVASSSNRLKREVEMVRRLPAHANVASYEACYTFTDATGEFDVAVMRYYSEGSLADLLSDGQVSPEQRVDLLCQILDGLEFLHVNRVIHRDLKPANIMIARRPDGRIVPKITDFGISKQASADDTMIDETVTTAATLNYASPEQLEGRPITASADVWSFGVIAYLLVTGRLPFNSGAHPVSSLMGKAETVRQVTSGALPADVASLPQVWRSVIEKCLVKDSAQRTVTERELRALLKSTSQQRVAPRSKNYVEKPDIDVPNVKQKTGGELKVVIVILVVALGVMAYFLAHAFNDSGSEKNRNQEQIMQPVLEDVHNESGTMAAEVPETPVEEDAAYADTVVAVEEPVAVMVYEHRVYEGTMTDEKGTFPIRISIDFDDDQIVDCLYTNLELGGKIKMAGKILDQGKSYMFTGRDGNNTFEINVTKDSQEGSMSGYAMDGSNLLAVKLNQVD